jgi:exodeoxyribonuclease VII large subunit
MDEQFGELWVEGEIGSLHRSSPGHVYFDLKDPDGQLRCALFRRSADRLRFDLAEGMLVRARARLDLYPERGTLQLIVEELAPAGEGALRQAFERMKQRLQDEGLFAAEHKQPLPALPARVGLVTSQQGAALHDFVRGLRRRNAGCSVLLYDARVQGENAWREVVRGLHLLDAQPSVDVIVLARGGGSLEDLWTFNREEVVRAIFALETPVVSAIGHEVDVVLTDLVADARAATPTAAAELVAPDGAVLVRQVDELFRRLVARQRASLAHERQRLEGLRRGLVHPAQRLAELSRRLGDARERLQLAARRDLLDRAATLRALQTALFGATRRLGERGLARLETLSARLDALSPLAVLGRGYALARRSADGVILRDPRDAPVGSDIDVRLAHGALRARVSGQTEES